MKAVLVLLVFLTACTSFSSMTIIGDELEDYDGDNILNIADFCPNSFYGEAVNDQGCTARQLRLKALKILPHQFDRIVRRIDRTTLRRAEQFISESLTHEYYQPNRSFLSCSGDNVFVADLNAMGALPILACKYVEEPRKVEVPVQAGRAIFITSSGFGAVIRVEPQQGSRIQIRELGYVACNEHAVNRNFSLELSYEGSDSQDAETGCPPEFACVGLVVPLMTKANLKAVSLSESTKAARTLGSSPPVHTISPLTGDPAHRPWRTAI